MSEHDEYDSAFRLKVEGRGKLADNQARSRILLAMFIVGFAYTIIIGRLAFFGFSELDGVTVRAAPDLAITAARPDIQDRNGEMLATDIITSSLYAEPRRIVDADEAVEKLLTALPDLNAKVIHKRLTSKAGFVWLKRELTPVKENEILQLGIPGIGFRTETRRFYPKGETASHLVGHVNIDNVGIAGLEKYIDDRGLKQLQNLGFARNVDLEPVSLSIDLRVQHFVRDELESAMKRYNAIAAGAVVLDVNTGEVVAMASLPELARVCSRWGLRSKPSQPRWRLIAARFLSEIALMRVML